MTPGPSVPYTPLHYGVDAGFFREQGFDLQVKEADGEYLYFVDVHRHCVVKTTLEGREIWTLGQPGHVGGAGEPFNRPTDIAFTPDASDGTSDRGGRACDVP